MCVATTELLKISRGRELNVIIDGEEKTVIVHNHCKVSKELGRHLDTLKLLEFNWRCCMNHIAGMVLACCLFVSFFFLFDTIRVCPNGSSD